MNEVITLPAPPTPAEPPAPQPPPESAPPPRPSRLARLRRLLPWLSMAMGITSALILDRRPERAWIVPLAVGLGWAVLTVMLLLHREVPDGAPTGRLRRVARFSSLVVTQSLFQLTVFFVGPLYWQAAALTLGHAVFLGLLGLLAACSLWDPLFAWLFRRPALSIQLLALAGFAGLDASLPFFGISTATSLWLAAGATAAIAPVVAWASAPRESRRRAFASGLVLAGALPFGLWMGGAAIVPAAPLRVVDAGIGPQIANRELVYLRDEFQGTPRQVVCATTIWAPLQLRDELVHVWRREGEVVTVVPLEIRGGRDRGFRTWSLKRHFGAEPEGDWTCTVETRTGQVLARRGFSIEGATARR